MSDKATLEIRWAEKYELPLVIVGSENEVAIDIKTLRSCYRWRYNN